MEQLLKALEEYQTEVGSAGLDLIEMGIKFITSLKEANPDWTAEEWKLLQMAFENSGAVLSAMCALEVNRLEADEG